MKLEFYGKDIKPKCYFSIMAWFLVIIFGNILVVLNGVLTRFDANHSLIQLASGIISGLSLPVVAFLFWCLIIKGTTKSDDSSTKE